jgi:hypothetical protein
MVYAKVGWKNRYITITSLESWYLYMASNLLCDIITDGNRDLEITFDRRYSGTALKNFNKFMDISTRTIFSTNPPTLRIQHEDSIGNKRLQIADVVAWCIHKKI